MRPRSITDAVRRPLPRFPGALLLFLFVAGLAAAAPLTRDLGRNLAYFRVHTLPADLPSTDGARKQPCVLDLRYVHGNEAAAEAVQAWVKFHAGPHTPVFVLANAETDAALLPPLNARAVAGNIIVIGAPSETFTPDIATPTTPENERRAYDALEAGTEISALMTENPDKVRNDEASLNKDHSSETETPAEDTTKPHPAARPIDAALQRAVHIHRALVALKRL
jgi:hypothetical protein